MTDSALFRDSATGDLRDASGPVTISGLPDPSAEPDGQVLTTDTGAAVWDTPAGGPPSGTAGGALDGTYPNPGLAAGVAGAGLAETSDVLSVNVDGTTIEINTDALRVKSGVFDAAGAAAAAQAASQPLDSDLTAIAGLDASTAGAISSDGAGWIKKTYSQFKTALSLVKGDVGLGNVDNTADASKVVASAAILTTARTIDGQSFDGSGNITVIAPGTHAATGKTTPVDADELALVDSAASNVLKKLTWANVKATLKTYFDTLYMAAGASATPSGAAGGDLTGTYPNPTIGASKVTSAMIVDGTIVAADMALSARARDWHSLSVLSSVIQESIPRWAVSNNGAILSTARLTSVGIPVLNGDVITGVSWLSATTALSAQANWWFAICDSSYNVIRQSTDQLNTGSWAANSLKTLTTDSVPVTAGARVASSTVTLTFPTLSQPLSSIFTAGDSIVVSNANVAAYNGTFTIVTVGASTITYVSGGSATDSLVAPFPTVQPAAGKRTYTAGADGYVYAVIMVKGTVPTLANFVGLTAAMALAPVMCSSGDTALTGTCPSPIAHGTGLGNVPWAGLS